MTAGKLITVIQPEIPIMVHRPATGSLIRKTIRKTKIQKIIITIITVRLILSLSLHLSLSRVTIRQKIILYRERFRMDGII